VAQLNKEESALVMGLMQGRGWEKLLKLVSLTINDLNSRQAQGSNEFEVLRSLFTKEARVAALREFFDDLENGNSLTGERT
jgi:hypothetical protein